MDYHALQQKLFALDPSDPREDLAKLKAQAGQPIDNVAPTTNYLQESAEVTEGSLGLDKDYSITDFAALAGVRLDERQKTGSSGQAKGSDPWPTAEPGRTEHPLKDKLVGDSIDNDLEENPTAGDAFRQGFDKYNKIDALAPMSFDKKEKTPKKEPKEKPQADKVTPDAQPKEDWPVSDNGYVLKKGDNVTYTNSTGQKRTAPVIGLLVNQKDGKGRPQIKLTLKGANFAISRQQITDVNGKPFTLKDAAKGTGTIKDSLLKALEAYKDKPKIKPRDPNAQTMQDLRKSGAMGAHKDKKKVLPRKEKHKGKIMGESYTKVDGMDAEALRKEYAKDWEIRKGKYLYKKVAFDDYNTVLRFLMVIEKPQIELDHFADIKFFYNEVELVVYTHDTKGLTTDDFKLAVQIDMALDRMGAKEIG